MEIQQTITIKIIHGELYYYAQQRKDGKVTLSLHYHG